MHQSKNTSSSSQGVLHVASCQLDVWSVRPVQKLGQMLWSPIAVIPISWQDLSHELLQVWLLLFPLCSIPQGGGHTVLHSAGLAGSWKMPRAPPIISRSTAPQFKPHAWAFEPNFKAVEIFHSKPSMSSSRWRYRASQGNYQSQYRVHLLGTTNVCLKKKIIHPSKQSGPKWLCQKEQTEPKVFRNTHNHFTYSFVC